MDFGAKFQKSNSDLKSVHPGYHMCQFFLKTDNFEFLDLYLRKLRSYVRYFGSSNVEGVAETWVEAK